jgi:hypothetical protein
MRAAARQAELQGLEDAYERDIEQILRSAYDKINDFRRKMEEGQAKGTVSVRAGAPPEPRRARFSSTRADRRGRIA